MILTKEEARFKSKARAGINNPKLFETIGEFVTLDEVREYLFSEHPIKAGSAFKSIEDLRISFTFLFIDRTSRANISKEGKLGLESCLTKVLGVFIADVRKGERVGEIKECG